MLSRKFKTITIYQHWSTAYDDWKATRPEKRSFKEQLLLTQSPNIDLQHIRSNDSYFNQIKKGTRPINPDAEDFGNRFFGINRKNQ